MLVLTDVGKVYVSGEVQTVALRNINLTIEDGEFVVILGPSGSGKSTLLNVISGLDTASSGTIMFNDECLTDLTEDQMTEFRRALPEQLQDLTAASTWGSSSSSTTCCRT